MTNKPNNSDTYETTRVAVSLAGIPIPDSDFTKRKISGLKMSDLRTSTIQTAPVSIQAAAIETVRLLSEYKKKIDEDVRVVRELLGLNPYFGNFQWVADAEARLKKSQRAKRKPGREKRHYTLNPEIVLGLVWVLRASGEAKSDRDAAAWLEISGIMSSTKVLRKLKQAKKDSRLKPMVSPPPDTWPNHSEAELIRMFKNAKTPSEGQTLRFELQGDHFQYVSTDCPGEQAHADENNS